MRTYRHTYTHMHTHTHTHTHTHAQTGAEMYDAAREGGTLGIGFNSREGWFSLRVFSSVKVLIITIGFR